jgi:hypothetical protein
MARSSLCNNAQFGKQRRVLIFGAYYELVNNDDVTIIVMQVNAKNKDSPEFGPTVAVEGRTKIGRYQSTKQVQKFPVQR